MESVNVADENKMRLNKKKLWKESEIDGLVEWLTTCKKMEDIFGMFLPLRYFLVDPYMIWRT